MRRGTRKMTGGGMGSTILDSDSNPVTDILQLGKVYTVHDNNCGLNYTLKISQPSKDNSTFQVELSDIKSGNLATKLGFGNQFTNFDYLLKSFYGILYSEKGTNTSGKAISSISELFDKAFNINNDKVNIKKILQMKCTPRKIKVGENDDNQTVKHLSQRVTDPNRFAVIDMDIKRKSLSNFSSTTSTIITSNSSIRQIRLYANRLTSLSRGMWLLYLHLLELHLLELHLHLYL